MKAVAAAITATRQSAMPDRSANSTANHAAEAAVHRRFQRTSSLLRVPPEFVLLSMAICRLQPIDESHLDRLAQSAQMKIIDYCQQEFC
jgi:hypothetical protein